MCVVGFFLGGCVAVFILVMWFLFVFFPAKGNGHKGLSVLPRELLFLSNLPPSPKAFDWYFLRDEKSSNNPASLACCRHRGCCHRLFSSAVPAAPRRGMCCLMQYYIPSVCPAQGALHCIAVLFLRKVLHQAAQGMWCWILTAGGCVVCFSGRLEIATGFFLLFSMILSILSVMAIIYFQQRLLS